MSFLIYAAILLAALVSVVMGLDVATAPPVRTAVRPPVEIRHEAAPAVPSPPPVAAQAVPPQQAAPPPRQSGQTSAQGEEQGTEQKEEPAPACNVQACEAAYRSFTASDCTYQPFDGPRRLCTK
jgi:hypothetical protein